MLKSLCTVLLAGSFMALGGCYDDKPHEQGQARGDLSSLDSRDRGLQSKDLVASTELLARDLLSEPALNKSKEQWTIVVDKIDNQTTDPRFNYDIFSRSLGTRIAKEGKGRVTLIENKAKFHSVQDRELEGGRGGDQFGQGAAAGGGMPAGQQPDFALVGLIQELPNRGTSTYRLEFRVTDLRNRTIVWTNEYMVKVER